MSDSEVLPTDILARAPAVASGRAISDAASERTGPALSLWPLLSAVVLPTDMLGRAPDVASGRAIPDAASGRTWPAFSHWFLLPALACGCAPLIGKGPLCVPRGAVPAAAPLLWHCTTLFAQLLRHRTALPMRLGPCKWLAFWRIAQQRWHNTFHYAFWGHGYWAIRRHALEAVLSLLANWRSVPISQRIHALP